MNKSYYMMALTIFTVSAYASSPANACQLVCMSTMQTYKGKLGGLPGADQKCKDEYGAGFRFVRSPAIIAAMSPGAERYLYTSRSSPGLTDNSMFPPVPGSAGANILWIGPVLNAAGTRYSCSDGTTDWNDDTGTNYGGGLTALEGGNPNPPPFHSLNYHFSTCNQKMPILCCNM